MRHPQSAFLGLLAFAAAAAHAQVGPHPVDVPLTMSQTAAGTYKASIDVYIGNLQQPIPFVFDTGSTGLHVFADVSFTGVDTGIRCTKTITQVVYGNPPRMIFSGVICHAKLQIGPIGTPAPVPIAYLTKATCASTAPPGCTPPNVSSYKDMHSYGIFGAGLTGVIHGQGIAPPPLLSLPGRYGRIYSIALSHSRGELILGSHVPQGAAVFHLIKADGSARAQWRQGMACLFVNEEPINTCLTVSFDTGNGVPWLHNVENPLLPLHGKARLVESGTNIGFAPPNADVPATSVVAGSEFWNRIRDVPVARGRIMANPGVQAFFDHVVTYDATYGTISFAPAGTAE
jgi:hypothetical protein